MSPITFYFLNLEMNLFLSNLAHPDSKLVFCWNLLECLCSFFITHTNVHLKKIGKLRDSVAIKWDTFPETCLTLNLCLKHFCCKRQITPSSPISAALKTRFFFKHCHPLSLYVITYPTFPPVCFFLFFLAAALADKHQHQRSGHVRVALCGPGARPPG